MPSGGAAACSRAAVLTTSPITVSSRRPSGPTRAKITSPVLTPTRTHRPRNSSALPAGSGRRWLARRLGLELRAARPAEAKTRAELLAASGTHANERGAAAATEPLPGAGRLATVRAPGRDGQTALLRNGQDVLVD